MIFKSLLLLVISGLVLCQRWNNKEVAEVLKDNRIIPDVFHEPAREFLKVIFPNGLEADRCNELTPTQVKEIPALDWSADPDAYYTIIMADPDFPSPKNAFLSPFLHWLVVNVPGASVDEGEVFCSYFGAGPPKDYGRLRYIFVVYEQPDKIDLEEPKINNTSIEGHINFSIEKFALKYGLGKPLAINCFLAQYDDYSLVLHKMFGFEGDFKL